MYNDIEIEYGFQTVLSTIPNQKEIDFEDDIEENYFKNYKKETENKDGFLYKPLKFYMLGSYDVCYITLIDNFKFSHRLFEPKREDNDTVYNDHTFQSFSGFALNKKTVLEKIFTNPPDNFFVGIINLKLNNGLYIGNGLVYIEAVYELIKTKLEETPFLLFQTFSWFELSLTVFVDTPDKLKDILSELRLLEFKDLNHNKFKLEDNLYSSMFKEEDEELDKIDRASVFSDTHTYFGFNRKLVNLELNGEYFKNFEHLVAQNKIRLKTEIEWHIKPGHIHSLEYQLSNHPQLKHFFDFKERQFVLGKSDYLLKESEDNILCNLYLIRFIVNEDYCDLFKNARRIKSYVYLDVTSLKRSEEYDLEPLLWLEKLNKLCVTSKEFHKIDSNLKSLKISRQVRNKILKIFSNYNNGIQNPILFPYFLDFKVFIDNLKRLVENEQNKSKTQLCEVRVLEKRLNENIKVFQEAYNVRFLNGYHFENISDFDLDFNSSIQQLLSSYGTLVYEYGKSFYNQSDSSENAKYAPIIQLNDIDTISNDLSINYSIHHLTSPEFVFATILKELLNHLKHYNELLNKEVLLRYEAELNRIKKDINESYLDDMFDSGLIDMSYLIIDSIRFAITFDFDFSKYQHWFWTYNFQNSSLFNTTGMINEYRLKMELFRIMFVKNIFQIKKKMKCPSPEIYTYWKRHYNKINKVSQLLIDEIDRGFKGYIKYFTENHFKKYESDTPISIDAFNLFNLLKKDVNFGSIDENIIFNKFNFLKENIKEKQNEDLVSIENLMSDLLNSHYIANNKKITSLKRNWEDGKSLNQFKSTYKDTLYSIDQTGGVYFFGSKNTSDYFKLNAKCLLEILDFTNRKKKLFIIESL